MIANLTEGLHSLSMDVYQADPCPTPSLSSGIANILLMQSPAHAWLAHPRLNPAYQQDHDSRLDQGSIAHAMLLERDESAVVVVDAPDWRTKAAKEARDAAWANGKHAILAHKFEAVQNMVAAVFSFAQRTELRNVFDTGIVERSLVWREGEIWCRARPDIISSDMRIVVDYKTCDSAQPDAVARQIGRMGYDVQASLYTRGMKEIGHGVEFIFLFQEISAPYACSLIGLANAYKEVGDAKVDSALKIWAECTDTDRWPAYSDRVLYAEPPVWEISRLDEQW